MSQSINQAKRPTQTETKENNNMAIINNFDEYFNGINTSNGEKKKAVPAGTYQVEVDALAVSSSPKSGIRIAKLEYTIKAVDSIEEGQSAEELELDVDKLINRKIKVTECVQIKSDKQNFIADRWTKISADFIGMGKLRSIFEENVTANGDMDGYLNDVICEVARLIGKKKIFNVTVKRERDGEYWRTKIQMPTEGP